MMRRIPALQAPPGNRLEALRMRRRGQHGIHINDQWRICFVWREVDADRLAVRRGSAKAPP